MPRLLTADQEGMSPALQLAPHAPDERPLAQRVLDPLPRPDLGGRVPPPRPTSEWYRVRERAA